MTAASSLGLKIDTLTNSGSSIEKDHMRLHYETILVTEIHF